MIKVGDLELQLDDEYCIHVIGGKVNRKTILALRQALSDHQLHGVRPQARIPDGHHIERLANLVGMERKRTITGISDEPIGIWK